MKRRNNSNDSSRKRRVEQIKRKARRYQFEQLERREMLTAGLDPVVVIPGFGGSFAQDQSPTGLTNWYTNRGLAPAQLTLEPFANSYHNLVESLENVGYQTSGPNQSLWVANWDWRLPVAPVDANALTAPDGLITAPGVTGASISDNTFATGLDYLGFVLKQIKTLHPTVTQVDVIAHSTGGLVARSYIQSAAYGTSFGAGLLPVIDDLVLAGVPNQGVSDPWNFLNDDFSEDSVSRGLGMVIDEAYDRMVAGATINGPDYSITNTPPISKTEFVRKYVGALRDLIPTYNVIDTNADGFFEKINPNWVEQGPGPVTNAQVVVPPNNPINGAIEAVAIHPTNKNIAYAATVNGGVWKTTNFTDANPTWFPLTDNLASLANGSIAFSPLDTSGNTLFVGTGSFSNGFDGDLPAGLLRTTDGGNTWSNPAAASVFGGSIRRILPTNIGTSLANQVVLAAAADGILRSTDGGQTFTQLNAANGLPIFPATDVIVDPNNSNRFYAAFPDEGVFTSTNGGLNWSRIDNNAGFNITGIVGSTNIELAVHDGGSTTVLYVGVVDSNQQLSGVFRDFRGGDGVDNNSANGVDEAVEFQFTVIGAAPDINAGSQGINNFAIVADPTSATDVYVGGDRLPNLFHGNSSSGSWFSIAGVPFANNTRPHADTRYLMFQDNSTLVTADDGGIYRMKNPLTLGESWTSAGGNINAIEFYSLAYDTNPGLLLGGTQDNGSVKQLTKGSETWNRFKFGDGGFQAHDRFTDADYALGNNFGAFDRVDNSGNATRLAIGANATDVAITSAVINTSFVIEITSNGHGLTTGQAVSMFGLNGINLGGFSVFGYYEVTVINANTFSLNSTDLAFGAYAGGSTWRRLGLDNLGGGTTDQQFAVAGGFEDVPMVTNAVRGNSIMFGRRGLYESATSGGDTIVSLTSQLSGKGVTEKIRSMVYGGRRAGVDRPGIFYVGTDAGKLYVRDESNTVTQRLIPGGSGTVRDIVVDPDDWQRAYVIQGVAVYATVDGGVNWTNITDNLLALTSSIRSITLANKTSQVGDGTLVIGGLKGVFSRSASTTPGGTWSVAAPGLPNVLVKDVIYESTNDTIYAGTFGRGAWSLSAGLLGSNSLVNSLMTDLNGGIKNAWINNVGRTNVVYSTEEETLDRLIVRNGPDERGFFTDEILSFTNVIGRRPNAGETWFESIESGHGGDGTVSTFSSIDPFLNDPNTGTKLHLKPITGAAAGTTSVGHTGLVNDPFSQTQILNAVGASAFSVLDLETNLDKNSAESALTFLQLKILQPAEALNEASNRIKNLLEQILFENKLSTALANVGISLADLLPIDDLWQNRVTNPLNSLLTSNPTATVAQIVSALNTGLHTSAFSVELDNLVEKSIRFNLDASFFTNVAGSAPSVSSAINLGAGNSLSAGGSYTFASNLTFGGVLGIDLSQGADLGGGLFIRDLNLTLGGSGSIGNINANVNLGPLAASVQNGSFEMSAAVGVALTSPTTDSSTVQLSEIVHNLGDIKNLIEFTPTATIDLELPLNLTNTTTNFNLADWGQPIVRASSANLFTTSPDIVVDIVLTDNLQDRVRSILSSLDAAADDIASRPAFNQEIPGIGRSLNGLLNDVGGPQDLTWGDVIKFEQAAEDFFGSFDPASINFDPAKIGQHPTVLGLRDAITAKIESTVGELISLGSNSSPIRLRGGVDLQTNILSFNLDIDGNFMRQVDLNLDSLGTQWTGTGVKLNANAQVDVDAVIDMGMSFGVGLSNSSGIDPFFNLNHFNINAAISGSGSELGFNIANGTIAGSITAQTLAIQAGATIVLANTAGPISDRLTITPSGALNVDFDFNATLFGTPLLTGISGLPSVQITDSNLFDSNPPVFTVDMAPMTLNLSGEALIQGLLAVAEWLDSAVNFQDTVSDIKLLGTKIPLLDKTVGELLASEAEKRGFDPSQILSFSDVVESEGFKRFTTQLNLGGKSASSVGIKIGDVMTFLSKTGEQFEAIVDKLDGEKISVKYDASRTDEPDDVKPSLFVRIKGKLSDVIKAAVDKYLDPEEIVPSLGDVLNDLIEPLGLSIANVAYNNTTKRLTMTPTFTPKSIEFQTELDFGTSISVLDFNASGTFLIRATPTIRLPLDINLASDNTLTAGNRVAIVDDAQPEVTLALSAQLNDPFARASLGFLSAVLAEDAGITPNEGIKFNTIFTVDVNDPNTVVGTTGRATVTELITPGNLAASFDPKFTGDFDIDGLLIKPEIAGASIPGQVEIFTTTTAGGSTRGIATFNSLSDLGSLFNKISVTNTIGSFESLTPEAIVAMFIQLGNSIENIASKLDVPNGLPFIQNAVDGIVNFAETTQDFGRQLYFNPKMIGSGNIQVTNGRLSKDPTLVVRIEGGEPLFITIPASSTSTNNSIDDLYADINAVLVAQGFSDRLVAERQVPFNNSKITSLTNISADAIPVFVQPLQFGFHRFRANFDGAINLFNLGIRVGDVIEYVDTAGVLRKATVDEMGLSTLAFRFDSTKQLDAATGATRQISLFGSENTNKLTIRTKSPTAGISLEMSTVQITASDDLPTQLTDNLSFGLSFNGGSPITVNVLASSTANNGTPEDMIDSLNLALDNTIFAGGGLNENVRAVLVNNRLRFVNLTGTIQSMTITGATILGFGAIQNNDTNTAVTELGLGASQLVNPSFRAGTIQDLVHLLNGLIQQQFNNSPFTASLNYSATPVRTVSFNIALGTEYNKTIDLDFSKGFDVGFSQLNVSGGAQATINASAGVELTVGFDIDPIGSGVIVGPATQLSTLDKGRGVQLKVGMTNTSTVNSSGRNNPVAPLTLDLAVRRFGNLTNNLSVTVLSPQISDNVVLSDLAFDLTREIKLAIQANAIPGLTVVNDISPIEVQSSPDGKLHLVANSKAINGLTINAGTSAFLGFTTGQVSSDPDLSISLRNGTTLSVNLDFSETLGDIKSKIEAAAGGPTVLEVTFVDDKIKLQDKTTQIGSNQFKIVAVADDNGISPVGSTLGILGTVVAVTDNPNTTVNETNNGDILIGTSLFRAPIADQFYVTIPNSKVFANLEIDSSDIDLITALGIFDIGVVDGTLNFTADASLGLLDIDDPDTPANESTDGKIRLKDFGIAGFGGVLDPDFTYGGSLNLPLDGTILSTLLPPEFIPLAISATLTTESPTSIVPKLDFNTSTLEAALGSFKNFNITDLIQVIQRVVDLLQDSDLKGLNKPIPVINKTPNEILEIVDGLADAAQDLLNGFDKEELLAKILELEVVQTQLNSTPAIVNKIQEQISKIKSVANASHLFQLAVPGLTQIASGLDISIDSTPTEVFNELTRIYGAGVIESVTGKVGEEYRVKFSQALGNVNKFKGTSPTGLAIQARTEIEGIIGSASEVQLLSFVKTGPLVAAIADLRKVIDSIPSSAQGRTALLDKFNSVAASVISRLNLGQI
ncbi:MAG: hypothetical protein ABL921_09305, partial [Pirellula sp.]